MWIIITKIGVKSNTFNSKYCSTNMQKYQVNCVNKGRKMSNFVCQRCGSGDSYTCDHRFSVDDSWCEFYIVCNECGTRYTVDATLIINRIEED